MTTPTLYVHPSTLAAEIAYVQAAPGRMSRIWRSMRAAWRCSRIARRNRRAGICYHGT